MSRKPDRSYDEKHQDRDQIIGIAEKSREDRHAQDEQDHCTVEVRTEEG